MPNWTDEEREKVKVKLMEAYGVSTPQEAVDKALQIALKAYLALQKKEQGESLLAAAH